MNPVNMTVVGRIYQEPETRTTESGTRVATITLSYLSGYGDRKKRNYVKLVAFNTRADVISKYARKDDVIFAMGIPSVEVWKDRNGEAHAELRLVMDRFEFCGLNYNKSDSQQTEAPSVEESMPQPPENPEQKEDDFVDIPF